MGTMKLRVLAFGLWLGLVAAQEPIVPQSINRRDFPQDILSQVYDTRKLLISKEEFATPNYTIYHHSGLLLKEIDAIVARHPSTMTMQIQGLDASGYLAEVRVVTVAAEIDAVNFDKKTRVLLNFGQHGRELITSEVALRLLKILSGEHAVHNYQVKDILVNTVFKIVPLENANGRKIVENGNLCERRNGRGVDPNRNWDVNWGRKEKDYDPAEEYPGTGPFSEPETKILQELARSFKPHLWVNVHSGMQALFMPYDHKNTTPHDGAAEPMELLLGTLNNLHCNNFCKVGSGGALVGYLAHGTATDYMYDSLKVPIAFTFEIYGDADADSDDCFRMFNPTTLSLFESVVSNWSLAFLTLVVNLPLALRKMPNRTQHLNQQLQSKAKAMRTSSSRKVRMLWDASVKPNPTISKDRTMLQFHFLLSGLIVCYICYTVIKRSCLRGRLRYLKLPITCANHRSIKSLDSLYRESKPLNCCMDDTSVNYYTLSCCCFCMHTPRQRCRTPFV